MCYLPATLRGVNGGAFCTCYCPLYQIRLYCRCSRATLTKGKHKYTKQTQALSRTSLSVSLRLSPSLSSPLRIEMEHGDGWVLADASDPLGGASVNITGTDISCALPPAIGTADKNDMKHREPIDEDDDDDEVSAPAGPLPAVEELPDASSSVEGVGHGTDESESPFKMETLDHATIAFLSDATGSLSQHVESMKNVANTLVDVISGIKATTNNPNLKTDFTIAAMRDWCDVRKQTYMDKQTMKEVTKYECNLVQLYINEEESKREGRVVPMTCVGEPHEKAALTDAITRMANRGTGCFGGGDAQEEYSTGIHLMRQTMAEQRKKFGTHPQIVVIVADDVHHSFSEDQAFSADNYPQGTSHMPNEDPKKNPNSMPAEAYDCPYAPGGRWKGGELLRELGDLLDEGVLVVWCAVGSAATGCETFLRLLRVTLKGDGNRDGFLYRYTQKTRGQNETLVPEAIAAIVTKFVMNMQLPITDGMSEETIEKISSIADQRTTDVFKAAGMTNVTANEDVSEMINRLAVQSSYPPEVHRSLSKAASKSDAEAASQYRSLATSDCGIHIRACSFPGEDANVHVAAVEEREHAEEGEYADEPPPITRSLRVAVRGHTSIEERSNELPQYKCAVAGPRAPAHLPVSKKGKVERGDMSSSERKEQIAKELTTLGRRIHK